MLNNPLLYGLVHVIIQSSHVRALLWANRYNGRLTAGIWAYILPPGELSSALLIAQNLSFSSL